MARSCAAVEFFRGHVAGVKVGQQPGFVQHRFGNMLQVVKRCLETERFQPLAGRLVAQFRLLAQREERLLAAQCGAVAGNVQHLVHAHVGRLQLARDLGKGAVVADVPAEMRQRDEYLARIGDDVPEAGVAPLCGNGRQGGGIPVVGKAQRLAVAKAFPTARLGEDWMQLAQNMSFHFGAA